MRIVLIGYRGTGKTTIGRQLAGKLGYAFVDVDPLIEQSAALPIAEIFRRFGEPHFRDLEARIIAQLDPQTPAVISTGGGAILRKDNVENLRRNAFVVWLFASPETLLTRIRADATTAARRPNLTALPPLDEIRHLLQQRHPLYQAASDIQIDTQNLSIAEILAAILSRLPVTPNTKPNPPEPK